MLNFKKKVLNIYNRYFSKHHIYWFLIAVGFLFCLLRIPSLYEPSWYGDEGIYQVVGKALNSGWLLYKDIWDNKPPLLYLIYSLSFGSLFLVKLYSLIAGLFAVVLFFYLAKDLFGDKYPAYLSTIVFTLIFGTPLIEGNIANAENFMLLPIIAASYIVIKYVSSSEKISWQILTGLLLSFAVLIKIVAIFDLFAAVIFLIIIEKDFLKSLKKTLVIFASFLVFPFVAFLYFFLNNIAVDFINGVFLQNISYVGEQYGSANPQLILVLKSILLVISLIIIFLAKKKMAKRTIFIYIIFVFSLFNAFVSDRPYMHYMLLLLPAFSLLVGHIFLNVKVRIIDLLMIALVIVFAYFHFNIYRKNISYYINFLTYITNNKNTFEYQSFFDRNTPRDYTIANFIKTHTSFDDNVFLISDSAQIYTLSGKLPISKYSVFYHMTYYENAIELTKKAIEIKKPKYIIQTIDNDLIYDLVNSYALKYILDGVKIYERQI